MPDYTFIENPDPVQISQIKALYLREGWWDPQDERDPHLITRIVRGSHCFVVACEEDEIVGMGRAISDGASDAYIQDVTVRDTKRGRGIGKAIVEKIVTRLLDDGLTWIGLIATGGSWRLYGKLGFTEMNSAVPMVRKTIV